MSTLWRFHRHCLIIRLVLPTTGDDNNVAHVSVTLTNPFTAELLVTGVRSNVSTHGIPLGTIEASTNFTSAGRSTTNSPNFDIRLNMGPAALFTVTRLYAVAAGLSTEQLDGIVDIGGYKYLPTTGGDSPSASPKKRGNVYTFVTLMVYERFDSISHHEPFCSGFNLRNFVDTAFKQLHSDVQLEVDVQIGQYSQLRALIPNRPEFR